MSIRVLYGVDGEQVMYDSVSMSAFGPVFSGGNESGLDDFIDWIAANYNRTNAGWFHDTEPLRFYSAYREWLKETKKEAA